MFAVQPPGSLGGDEKLGIVGVGSSQVGHGNVPRAIVAVREGFVAEVRPVDALASGPVFTGDVSPLDHEVRNDAMDSGSLVPKLGLKMIKM